jgi:hypothetical protein
LICHDFQEHLCDFAGLPRVSPSIPGCVQLIDRWLIANVAFISKVQSAQQAANTRIPITSRERTVHRPPRYGRAAIMSVGNDATSLALFDVKGCGVPPGEVPEVPKSNGLLTLEEAIFEFTMEGLVYSALRHAGNDVLPVPAYAIIDLGFDALWHAPPLNRRASLLVRRAQTRPEYQWGEADPGPSSARLLLQVEMCLRRYGISASICGAVRFRLSGSGGCCTLSRDGRKLTFNDVELDRIRKETGYTGKNDLIVDGVNVQLALGALGAGPVRIMDFGRYHFCSSFNSVAYSWWKRDYEKLVGEFLRPNDPGYIQPDPSLTMGSTRDHPLYAALQQTRVDYEYSKCDRQAVSSMIHRFVVASTTHLAG